MRRRPQNSHVKENVEKWSMVSKTCDKHSLGFLLGRCNSWWESAIRGELSVGNKGVWTILSRIWSAMESKMQRVTQDQKIIC